MCPFRDSPELTAELVERQLGEYDVASAAATTARLRDTGGLVRAVDDLLGIHEKALEEWRARHAMDEARELVATAKYLRELTPAVKSLEEKQRRIHKLESSVEALKESNRILKRRLKTSEPGARLVRHLRKSISGRLILSSVKRKLAGGGSEENDAAEAQ